MPRNDGKACHSEGEKRVLNEVKELKLLRFTQDELRISLRVNSGKGKNLKVGERNNHSPVLSLCYGLNWVYN